MGAGESMLEVLFSPPSVCFFIVLLIILSFFKSNNSGSSRSRSRSQRAHASRKPERPKLAVADLAARLGMLKADLECHEVQYKTASIPKRSGGKRVLHVPDRVTKMLQRKLLRQVVGRFPIHPDVHGFRKGHSIVDNAAKHSGQEVIVKLDVVDFFPSTSRKRITGAFRGAGFDKSASELLTGLTCWEGGLPQGAPTSPALSNYVNKNMDKKLAAAASRRGARYTRYADDITFSLAKYSRDNIHQLLISTGKILQYYGYRLNGKKKRIIRDHRQQLVTGLVVNERVNLPRKTRRWLRSVKHRMETGGKATLTNSEFRGWLSLLNMVDANSPLLEFREELNSNKQNIDTPIVEGHDESNSLEVQRSELEATTTQTSSAAGADTVAERTVAKTAVDVDTFERLAPMVSDNHSIVKTVEALMQTEIYTENRKNAEAQLAGSKYIIEISVTSIGRTFSFSLPKAYQSGQTLKAALCNEELSLELYCDEKTGSELASKRLPFELKVLVEVVQWNAIFKRIEAVVLQANT